MSDTEPERLPIAQIPVGEILGRELEARDWTQAELAAVLDRPTQFVSEIVTGKKEITRESAAQIAAALGHTAEYWLKLQDQYLLAEQSRDRKTQERLSNVRRRASLNDKGPIQLLRKRGILRAESLDELESEVLELFEIRSMDEEPSFAAAAKRSNRGEELSPLQLAWVASIRRVARQALPSRPFMRDELENVAARLARTLTTPADFARLPETLNEAGVRLVYVESFPGSKIDGCALFVGTTPVIGLSGRGKRLDKVLFALLHEAAHIVRGHVDADTVLVEDLEDRPAQESQEEREADDTAQNWVFPEGLPPLPSRVSATWIASVAAKLSIAPIVLVGQLQHRKWLDWRTTLAKNAPTVNDVLERWR
jgi:HTH-type transcriptional regulator/antitoxin HigA